MNKTVTSFRVCRPIASCYEGIQLDHVIWCEGLAYWTILLGYYYGGIYIVFIRVSGSLDLLCTVSGVDHMLVHGH